MLTVVGPVGGPGAGHDTGAHPERPSRIESAMAGVGDLRHVLGGDLEVVDPVPARVADLQRVHSRPYLRQLEGLCRAGGGALDPDTVVGAGSWEVARAAAGAGLVAIERLRQRGDGAAFVVARPPGHHAVADRGMGFCLLNNVAVAASALAAVGERVLIVDWDVHHGNGTQEIFWDDPRVLYVSTHQWPYYPGTGAAGEVGGPGARGLTVNVPLPAAATGDVVCRALDEVAAPVVDAFGPTWVLVSAGFDAHRADPLAAMALSSGDFADLAAVTAAWVPRPGRLVGFLEGGYDLSSLRASVTATLGVWAGMRHGDQEPPTAGGPGREAVTRAKEMRARSLQEPVATRRGGRRPVG